MGAPKWMGIGIGIFILAALWVFSLFICILLAGAGRKMRLLSLGIFIFSSFISLLLIYFPKQDSTSLTPSSSMEVSLGEQGGGGGVDGSGPVLTRSHFFFLGPSVDRQAVYLAVDIAEHLSPVFAAHLHLLCPC
uniref:Transmembrane protein 218 N-terminal domain-containing protein n=1 Tax=Eptatretus burgeri TaxID=7764 RepID=A0A8C4QV66_EPTBU